LVSTNTDQGWNFAENYPPISSRESIGMSRPSSDTNHDDRQADAVKDEKKQKARKVIEEWSKEQERKKNIGISVSEAIRLHNEDVSVRGVIVSISGLFKMIKQRTSICRNDSCNKLQVKIYEQPRFTDYQKKYGNVCPACTSSESPKILYDYINAVAVKIQDDEPYTELEQLDCLLFGRDILNIRPGEIVQVKGHIEVEKRKDRLHPVIHTQSIKYKRREEPVITSKNIESFIKFAKMPNVIDRLVSMFAPNVIGHKVQKLGILRSVVGAPETSNLRGRINTLLIGPPGVAKSMLTREAVELVPNSRYVTAQNASGKGVTAIIDKENDTTVLRLGAVPQARGAVCAINEIGRMDYVNQAFLLDVMEEGQFTLDKYGIHVKIKSPTTIIATTNPNGTTWNTNYHISNSEIPVLNTLRDRFDQICGISEFLSMEENREYAEKKAAIDAKNIQHNCNYLKMYFEYAKTISPVITPEAQSMLVEFWLELKVKELATNRTLDSLFRLAKAQARMHLSDIIDVEITTEVMHSYSQAMLQYGQIIKIIESPRDVTYREMLSILKLTRAPVELTEAARMACERNEQVKSYLGPRLDLKHSWKLKAVRDMLVNNPSIRQVNDKPIVLQWCEGRQTKIIGAGTT
jgi:replicative DNA helicase Mcm